MDDLLSVVVTSMYGYDKWRKKTYWIIIASAYLFRLCFNDDDKSLEYSKVNEHYGKFFYLLRFTYCVCNRQNVFGKTSKSIKIAKLLPQQRLTLFDVVVLRIFFINSFLNAYHHNMHSCCLCRYGSIHSVNIFIKTIFS